MKLQSEAKAKVHRIWIVCEKKEAECHFDDPIKVFGAKYLKAPKYLESEGFEKAGETFSTFYDFPAGLWHYTHTTNPILSQSQWGRGSIPGLSFTNIAYEFRRSGWRKK